VIHFLFFNKNVVFLFLFLFLLGNLNCVGAGADAAGGEVMFTRQRLVRLVRLSRLMIGSLRSLNGCGALWSSQHAMQL
tara:strand:- start:306 stop:539 length:234 start_codon:yes stop_codon:yes gene_type:complete